MYQDRLRNNPFLELQDNHPEALKPQSAPGNVANFLLYVINKQEIYLISKNIQFSEIEWHIFIFYNNVGERWQVTVCS
jgi:hypothetical protein